MSSRGDIGTYNKDLERRRDSLLDDLKALEGRLKKGEMTEDQYKEQRHKIERALVEVMDRLAQMRFLKGQT
ncbi:MAG: hypothetical protein ACETWE_10110 [Candidatus Bathyarchaeia archaeon]